MDKKKISVYLFRRDLRIQDNTALFKCMSSSDIIIPCFIFDVDQVTNKNKYKSDNCLQFMVESLINLDDNINKANKLCNLNVFYGNMIEVLDYIHKNSNFNSIFFTMDYTPYARHKSSLIESWCRDKNIEVTILEDILLHKIKKDKILKSDGTPYKKFTPYYREACKIPISAPRKINNKFFTKFRITKSDYSLEEAKSLYQENPNIYLHGGRNNCIKQLKKYNGTNSNMSAYNKFGCISIRELYVVLKKKWPKKSSETIRGLYWRDFYYRIVWYFPHVLKSNNRNFNKKFGDMKWYKNNNFERWCNGTTGFPIVDAGMRQLNKVGYINNRNRLIVSSFLVKDLHINWEEGEKYFAKKLIDYDPSQNNGNWQWVAGSGVDSQPYFRIFNPWNQSEKYDENADYIKEWIPELRSVPANDIHEWYKNSKNYGNINYPMPILDHNKEKNIAVNLTKNIL